MFRDRIDAAEQLAERLGHLKGRHPLVLGIPRGAMPMAKVLADRLEGEMDVVLVHKIGAPGNPEYAIGAVSEDGRVQLTEDGRMFARDRYLSYAVESEMQTLRERRRRYTPDRRQISLMGRTVVVVDDGSATGATMLAALSTVREQQPERVIAALGVSPTDVLPKLEALADEVVCLARPDHFFAVSQFFRAFPQVSDTEVIHLLQADRRQRERGGGDHEPADGPG